MLCVVVLHRGFVYVGERSITRDGGVLLENARCVRRWGSEQHGGLAALANKGPTDATLEDLCVISYHPLAEMFRIQCAEKAWKDA